MKSLSKMHHLQKRHPIFCQKVVNLKSTPIRRQAQPLVSCSSPERTCDVNIQLDDRLAHF
jgi:hypothetical protein